MSRRITTLAVGVAALGLVLLFWQNRSPAIPVVPQPQPTPTATLRPTLIALPPADSTPARPSPMPVASATPQPSAIFNVAVNGSDATGNGSAQNPWATISHALTQAPDGALILVQPGLYAGQVVLRGNFERGVTVRSAEPYRAQLRHNSVVVAGYYARGVTLEGFDIAHSGPDSEIYVVQIQDLLGEPSGSEGGVSRIVLRDNILHDSFNNDILKINRGASHITVEGNILYNQAGLDSHIDANSVTDVLIQDNIFFNDFEGSNRPDRRDTGSFVVIKDSNGDEDANLGSRNVTVRRNVFLKWQGDSDNTFVVVGEDNVTYFRARQVLIENNLMIGNSPDEIRAPVQIRGARNVTFRHNTVVGDLPAKAFGMRLSRAKKNPKNEDIYFFNNIWSDPTGTMGAGPSSNRPDFADADPDDTASVVLGRNLYWNGNAATPFDRREAVNFTDDPQRIISDPLLPAPAEIILPRWLPADARFADGSASVREAFVRLVTQNAPPAPGSLALDAADPAHAPPDDILRQPRPAGSGPDLGAFERPAAN